MTPKPVGLNGVWTNRHAAARRRSRFCILVPLSGHLRRICAGNGEPEPDAASALGREAEERGARFTAVEADLADPASPAAVFDAVEADLGSGNVGDGGVDSGRRH